MAMKHNYRFITSPIIIAAFVCFLIGGIFWVIGQRNQEFVKTSTKTSHNISFPSQTPSTAITSSPVIKAIAIPNKPMASASSPTSIPIPINTPSPQPTTTPTPISTIILQINEPDGNISFSLEFHSASTPCSILDDAKNEGKIRSATITHYGPPLNSDYVKEINGYSDNWTFAINGTTKPTGCSNYQLNSENTVTWTYQ